MSCTTLDRKSTTVASYRNAGPVRLHDTPLLTAEQECELARALAQGDRTARDRLVQSNLRLVIVIARDYLGRGLVMEDLVGEGNLGLFRAAEEFDPNFGCRFSTYAAYWIRQAIRHALINTTATIRLPAHMVSQLSKLGKAGRELSRGQGRMASFDQVVGRMGLSDVRRDLASCALRSRRLQPIPESEGCDLASRATDPEERPEAEVERSDNARWLVDRMVEKLDNREREVLRRRFGLDGLEPMTLQEVGRSMGITREWVRKIEIRAIHKMGEEPTRSADDRSRTRFSIGLVGRPRLGLQSRQTIESQEINARLSHRDFVVVGWAPPTSLSPKCGGRCPPYGDQAACISFLTHNKVVVTFRIKSGERGVAFLESSIDRPVRRGKVRDIYDLGDRLLLVATDRISAYDWVLPTGIADKGRVLTALSAFWFHRLGIEHHLISTDIDDAGLDLTSELRAALDGRVMIARKCEVIPFECVVRGYLSGSGWREYRRSGTVCEAPMPAGLVESDRLPTPIFTPATKAEAGHDENVSIQVMADVIGQELTATLVETSLELFDRACRHAESRGLILADTKFEFGRDPRTGKILLIDEALTPDSSRYWPKDEYKPGGPQPSIDKQYVRDWLDASGWDKASEPPALPDEVVAKTRAKYIQAYETLTEQPFPWK